MAGADPSNAAEKNEQIVDGQAPQCDEAAGHGKRMGPEESVRYWLVGCTEVSWL